MMNNNGKLYPLFAASVIAIILDTAINVYMLCSKNSTITEKIATLTCVIALVCAMFYTFEGCKKNASLYYKSLFGFAAINQFGYIINDLSLDSAIAVIAIIINFIIMIMYLYIFFGRNIGRIKSLLICSIIVVVRIIILVLTAINFPGVLVGGTSLGTRMICFTASNLLIAVISTICTYEKYEDKKARNAI